MTEKINILGCRIDNVDIVTVLNMISGFIIKHESIFIVTPNIDHVVKLQNDSEFRKVYDDAALVLADGMPIIWASYFLGVPLKQKISGSDLFPKLCEFASKNGYKIFFLGGREGAALKSAEVLRSRYPVIHIVGVYSPPFGFENDDQECEKIMKMIKESKPDILFVGLGAPKQEKWIYKHYKELGVPVSIGIGATFEFVSGMIKRAPVWMQDIGLEWFWRLIMEPGRLWKRYLIDDMKFFWLVLKQKMRRKQKHFK